MFSSAGSAGQPWQTASRRDRQGREDSFGQLEPPSLGLLEHTHFREEGLATLGKTSLDTADELGRPSAPPARDKEGNIPSYMESGRKLSALRP